MRKILLITLMIAGVIIPAFTQINNHDGTVTLDQ